MQVIFKGVVGSRLYGTANENSDYDYMAIALPSAKEILLGADMTPSHSIEDGVDTVTVPFRAFLYGLLKGSPNYWECIFAHHEAMLQVSELQTLARVFKTWLSERLPLSYLGMARNALHSQDYYHYARAIDSIHELCETKIISFPHKNAEQLKRYKYEGEDASAAAQYCGKLNGLRDLINNAFGASTEDFITRHRKAADDLIYNVHYTIILEEKPWL